MVCCGAQRCIVSFFYIDRSVCTIFCCHFLNLSFTYSFLYRWNFDFFRFALKWQNKTGQNVAHSQEMRRMASPAATRPGEGDPIPIARANSIFSVGTDFVSIMILATLVYISCNIYSYISMENDSRPIKTIKHSIEHSMALSCMKLPVCMCSLLVLSSSVLFFFIRS